jgi:hypothetical protein
MSFLNLEELDYKPLSDGGKYDKVELTTDLKYLDEKTNKVFVVPKGFISDGASIPKFVWSLAGSPLSGGYLPAAFLHDYLCYLGVETKQPITTWQKAASLFYDAMLSLGCKKGGLGGAQAKYLAVMTFGPKWNTGGIVS